MLSRVSGFEPQTLSAPKIYVVSSFEPQTHSTPKLCSQSNRLNKLLWNSATGEGRATLSFKQVLELIWAVDVLGALFHFGPINMLELALSLEQICLGVPVEIQSIDRICDKMSKFPASLEGIVELGRKRVCWIQSQARLGWFCICRRLLFFWCIKDPCWHGQRKYDVYSPCYAGTSVTPTILLFDMSTHESTVPQTRTTTTSTNHMRLPVKNTWYHNKRKLDNGSMTCTVLAMQARM